VEAEAPMIWSPLVFETIAVFQCRQCRRPPHEAAAWSEDRITPLRHLGCLSVIATAHFTVAQAKADDVRFH
jgi:hypothetical protein